MQNSIYNSDDRYIIFENLHYYAVSIKYMVIDNNSYFKNCKKYHIIVRAYTFLLIIRKQLTKFIN